MKFVLPPPIPSIRRKREEAPAPPNKETTEEPKNKQHLASSVASVSRPQAKKADANEKTGRETASEKRDETSLTLHPFEAGIGSSAQTLAAESTGPTVENKTSDSGRKKLPQAPATVPKPTTRKRSATLWWAGGAIFGLLVIGLMKYRNMAPPTNTSLPLSSSGRQESPSIPSAASPSATLSPLQEFRTYANSIAAAKVTPQGTSPSPSIESIYNSNRAMGVTASPSPVIQTYRVKAGHTLNIRQGPGADNLIVTQLPEGTRGIVLGEQRKANGPTMWQQISVEGYSGWVNEEFLETESVVKRAMSVTPSPSPMIQTYRVKSGHTLNIRQGPGADYPVVTQLPEGTRGIALGEQRQANGTTMWQQVSVEGYSGWVNEIFLEAEPPEQQ
jgi:uncharacterized protein YgiM (DUF1202 family)